MISKFHVCGLCRLLLVANVFFNISGKDIKIIYTSCEVFDLAVKISSI